jgi:hypothetical protein
MKFQNLIYYNKKANASAVVAAAAAAVSLPAPDDKGLY